MTHLVRVWHLRPALLGFVVVVLGTVLAGCGDKLPRPALIDNLRIVAVQAEPPEAAAGTTVALSSLVLQPDASAAVERVWAACVVEPGQSAAGCALPAPGQLPPPCASEPEASFCIIGSDASASYVLPELALRGRPAGAPGQVVVTLVAAASAEGGVAACTAGLEDPARLPESCRAAVKRVKVLPAGVAAANTNPGIASFSREGDLLSVALAEGAIESTPGGAERLFLSWYVSAGELDKFRTDAVEAGMSNPWTPPAAAGTYQAAVVVRDGRGGESWRTLELTVP